ncbi:MAG: toprim domain-containing protein [Planctomycetales bacterium]|nr:toprim domain-containing protein [Planctomycetales bacterium]
MNIKQAKQIPLENYLRQLGHSPSRESGDQAWYLSPFRKETKPSFKLNRSLNCWYDFGEGKGGDIIDLVMQLCRLKSVSDALQQLEDGTGQPTIVHDAKRPRPEKAPALELERVGPVKARSLINYLRQRGIDPVAASPYVKEVHYRHGDKRYFALGLENDSGSYELRNPYFKGSLGTKDISVIKGQPDRVLVFEGMFDFLTWTTMHNEPTHPTIVVLNSAALQQRAIERIHELDPQVVELYRDRDEAGKRLLTSFRESLANVEVVDKSEIYPDHNDLNDHYQQARAPSR